MSMSVSEFRVMYNSLSGLSNSEASGLRLETVNGDKTKLQVSNDKMESVGKLRKSESGLAQIEDNIYLKSRLLTMVRDTLSVFDENNNQVFVTDEALQFFKETETRLFGKTDKNNRFANADTASTFLTAATLNDVISNMDRILKASKDIPETISPESNPSDQTRLPHTAKSLPIYKTGSNEVDGTLTKPLVNEAPLLAKIDNMINVLGRHARQFGGAPHFNQRMPRLDPIATNTKTAFGKDANAQARFLQQQIENGGVFGFIAKVGAKLSNTSVNNTPFERAALFLDSCRRLANNLNYVLDAFAKKDLETAVEEMNNITKITSHTKWKNQVYSKQALTSDAERLFELLDYSFRLAEAKGKLEEFFNICAKTACFQDVVSSFTDYLVKNDCEVFSEEEFQAKLKERVGESKAYEAAKAKGEIVADPTYLRGIHGGNPNARTLSEVLSGEIEALQKSYPPAKKGEAPRIFTKDEVIGYLKKRLKQLNAEQASQPEKGLSFLEWNDMMTEQVPMKYEDTPEFWKKVEDTLIEDRTIKDDDKKEYHRGVSKETIKWVTKKVIIDGEEIDKREMYNEQIHGPAGNLKDGYTVKESKFVTDKTQPNPDYDFEYKKGDIKIIAQFE